MLSLVPNETVSGVAFEERDHYENHIWQSIATVEIGVKRRR